MTKLKTIQLLKQYNWWSLGLVDEKPSNKEVTEALFAAVKHLKESVRAGKLKKARAMKAKAKAKA